MKHRTLVRFALPLLLAACLSPLSGCASQRDAKFNRQDQVAYRQFPSPLGELSADDNAARKTEWLIYGDGQVVRTVTTAAGRTQRSQTILSSQETEAFFQELVTDGVLRIECNKDGAYSQPLHTQGVLAPSCQVQAMIGGKSCVFYCLQGQTPAQAQLAMGTIHDLIKSIEPRLEHDHTVAPPPSDRRADAWQGR